MANDSGFRVINVWQCIKCGELIENSKDLNLSLHKCKENNFRDKNKGF